MQRRIEIAGFRDGGTHGGGVRYDDGQHTGDFHAHVLQNRGLGGVAVGNGLLMAETNDGIRIHFQDFIGDARILGDARQMLAADAEAHDDQVVLKGGGAVLHRFRFFSGVFPQAGHKGGGFGSDGDKSRREHHGQDADGKKLLVVAFVEQTPAQPGSRQHESEFAHLGQRQGNNDGGAQGVALHQHGRKGQQCFHKNEQQRIGRHRSHMIRQIVHIQQHAHGNEEQAHEDVAVGEHAGDDAHAVFGACQQQTGQKSAERQGKAQR